MTSPDLKTTIEADSNYASQKFTFTFTRTEISTIVASVLTCKAQLSDAFDRQLCERVLDHIQANEVYQQSKRPSREGLS